MGGCDSTSPFCRSTQLQAVSVAFHAAVVGGCVAVLTASHWTASATTVVVASVASAVVSAVVAWNAQRLRVAGSPLALAEAVLVTLAVRATGGAGSEAYLLYFPVIAANLLEDQRFGYGLATVIAGMYAAATIPFAAAGPDDAVAVALYRAAALLATGVGTSSISQRFAQCSRAASAVNAKLKMRDHWDEAMLRISRGIDSGLGLTDTLGLILDSGLGVLHGDVGLVVLKDRSGRYTVRAARTAGGNILGNVIDPSEGAVGLCMERRMTVLYPGAGSSGMRFREVEDFHLAKMIATPLFAGSEMVGAIAFGDRRPGELYGYDDVEFIESLAKQLSVVVVNANLLEEARRRADYLTSLNQISMSITSVLEPYDLFEKIYKSVCQVLPLDAFFVALPLDDPTQAEMAFLMDKGVRSPSSRLPLGDSPTGKVMRSGRPLLANLDESSDTQGFSIVGAADDDDATRSVMIAPMKAGNRVVGAISAQSYTPNAYGEEELELLMTIAGSAAVALENSQLYQAAREQSITDQLTGLGNYRLFHEVFSREIERSRRYSTPLSLIMIDSDSLKDINDTYGHAVGDMHLRHITKLMTTVSRKSDYVVRYAGDEFMIILPNTGGAEAMAMAERLRSRVEKTPFTVDGQELSATVSIGVASFPESGSDVETMLKSVDEAMYASKRVGRNRVTRALAAVTRSS